MALFVPLLLLEAEDKTEILAGKIVQENNITKATNSVLIRDKEGYIDADQLLFCKDSGEVEIIGDIYADMANDNLLISDYIKYQDGDRQKAWSDNIFVLSRATNMWLSGIEARRDGNITRIRSGSVSSCQPRSPEWSMRFSSAKIDSEKEWVDLYNPRIYAGRTPIFYLPYFGYSTNTKRRTGFLFPKYGTSNREGTMAEVPFYIAPYDQWDIELYPQLRSERGQGYAGVFRWVDSPYSKGSLSYGIFKDKAKFTQKYDLLESDHDGFSLKYERDRLFTKPNRSSQEGLVMNYEKYSDVEFVQLESMDPKIRNREISHLITNKIDYFYKNDNFYLGSYTRYFDDIRDDDQNDKMVQVLPESHAHIFTRKLFFDNLLFSLDTRHKNYDRKIGTTAQDFKINLPISYHLPLFDDYLKFKASWYADYYQIDYTDAPALYEKGVKTESGASFELSSMLAKPYQNLFHIIDLSTTYTEPAASRQKGTFDTDFTDEGESVDAKYSTLLFKFAQYFYNDNGRHILTQKLSQPVVLDENNTKLDLEHEIVIEPVEEYTLRNLSNYSHEFDAMTKSTTTFAKSGKLSYSLTYLYENKTGKEVSNRYLTTKAGYKLNSRHSFEANYARDLLQKEERGWQIAHIYNKKCWQTELSYTRKISPYINSQNQTASREDDIIFLKIQLIPLGEFGQQLYEKEKS